MRLTNQEGMCVGEPVLTVARGQYRDLGSWRAATPGAFNLGGLRLAMELQGLTCDSSSRAQLQDDEGYLPTTDAAAVMRFKRVIDFAKTMYTIKKRASNGRRTNPGSTECLTTTILWGSRSRRAKSSIACID